MLIYNLDDLSTFLDEERNSDSHAINSLLHALRERLLTDHQQIFEIGDQPINTENDLKCMLFHKAVNLETDLQYEVHSEESDLIAIHDGYCAGLTLPGDIERQETRTRTTDMTITIDPVEGGTIGIEKGYSRFGLHIDIELKYIREGFKSGYLKDIRRDLCKLKYVVDTDQEHHVNENGDQFPAEFGLFFLGFRMRSVLERYLNEGLRGNIDGFNQLEKVALLLFYREDDI
jgi:hypothetical protein